MGKKYTVIRGNWVGCNWLGRLLGKGREVRVRDFNYKSRLGADSDGKKKEQVEEFSLNGERTEHFHFLNYGCGSYYFPDWDLTLPFALVENIRGRARLLKD